mgnify:CR=1 FL=1
MEAELAGSAVAGRDDRTAGAVIGGLAGAVIGNQVAARGGVSTVDCSRAYGYYDENSRWHATGVRPADARGYYDREGGWVAGAPNGYYGSANRWVANTGTTEQDGYFLGRGVADDKSMAAILTANLLRYKKEGWVPERDLILALTADEEGGGDNGVSWLIANHRELIDAEYAINEGGGGTLQDDKPLFHSIQAAEKVYNDFTLTVLNTGGHSSVPRKDNAIYSLANALARIEKYTFPVELNDITRPFFEQTAKVEMPSLAAAMKALVANPTDTAAARIISTDPRYASMLRTTCVATRLSAGHANNALPQTATANVNCRIAPTSTGSQVKAALERVIGDATVKITGSREDRKDGAPGAINATLLQATTQLTNKMFGGVPVIPTMSTGATDGYRLRAVGIPTYGVSGIFSSPGETNAHGRDEKLRVKSFYDGLDFLYELVKQVAGPNAGKPIS